VTFGSTNALMKLNDRLLSLWGRVLGAVPGSRLLIKARGLERASTAADLRGRLAAAGVDAARCRLEGGQAEHADHLRAYAGIDVLLDTWPYHGTTTTLEALWMGVPVVSLVGEAHASRVGLSLLTAAGVPELAVASEVEYVAKAARLATDATERARVSRGLRERVVGGPLCDGPGFCRRFEAGVRAACEQG
jgi:predicted O-linked N-acetylglucosamine transferase (SPINDLY family)